MPTTQTFRLTSCKTKVLKFFLTSFSIILLTACGSSTEETPNTSSNQQPVNDPIDIEEDFPDIPELPEFEDSDESSFKPFLRTNLNFSSNHHSIVSNTELFGISPLLTQGSTIIFLYSQVENGWAIRFFDIEIKDSDGVNGQYNCVPAIENHEYPDLQEGECFIRFDNDSYVGYSESWAVGESSCTINVTNAVLGAGGVYEDFAMDINCTEMINAFDSDGVLPAPDGSDLESTLTISGEVFSSENSGQQSPPASLQNTTLSLSSSGGDGIIDTDINLDSTIGFSYVPGIFFGYFQDESGTYSVNIYINAPYDINGTFECVNPPTHLGTSVALFVDDRECLITIEKTNPDWFSDWVWDSRDGGDCTVTITNVRFEGTAYPLYDFQASVNCPNMVSRSITYDFTYPSDVKPSNVTLQGNINFEVIF